jgi:hypothetical protein
MKICIVCYEDVDRWIVGKFAMKLDENLKSLGYDSNISKTPDSTADINHHIISDQYDNSKNSIDTVMVAHIDNITRLDRLKNQNNAIACICMSSQTVSYLSKMGLDNSKLCYINPAHDGMIPVRKIIIGISCRVQEDGRKREYFLSKLSKDVDPNYFKFKIMGDSWDDQVSILRINGFEVDYHNEFDYQKYLEFIPSLDYYLYMGMDEGQMGFIDAAAVGIKTIVTAQGYHLDAPGAVTHAFAKYNELRDILLKIQTEKQNLTESVVSWNWKDYTIKHVEIWEHLLGHNGGNSAYSDGLNSLLASQQLVSSSENMYKIMHNGKLIKAKYLHIFYSNRKWIKDEYIANGLWGVIKFVMRKIIKKFILFR